VSSSVGPGDRGATCSRGSYHTPAMVDRPVVTYHDDDEDDD
jgi:hypothetical protein